MYMFFWFFKQFYYCFRRIFKSGILLLIVFFIAFLFIFIKPTFAANVYVPQAVKDKCDSLVFHNNVVVYNSSNSLYYVIYPYDKSDYNYSQSQINTMTNGSWTVRTRSNKTCIINPVWTGSYYITYNGSSFSSRKSVPIDGFDISNNYTIVYANHNLIAKDLQGHTNGDVIYRVPTVPFIENNSSTIIDFSFDNLIINCLDLSPNDYYELEFTYPSNSTIINGNIDQFKTTEDNNLIFNIPKSWITQNIVIRSGATITFDLIRYHRQEPSVTEERYSLGSYTLSLTPEQEEDINEDSNKQLLSDINNTQQQTNNKLDNLNSSQQETTQAVENLNDNLLNETVPNDNEFSLPSVDVNDITSNFFTTLFNNLYNAITNANDTTITINLFSHTYTISSSQFNFLDDNRFNALSAFLQASWYGSIGFYIIYDIRKMINKIKQGNIENISNDDIQANSV